MGLPATMDVVVMAGQTEAQIAADLGVTMSEPQPGDRLTFRRSHEG